MTAPVFVSGPDPVYTADALRREVQGTVIVQCVVTVEGNVRDCLMRKVLPYMNRAVVRAVEEWRFTPATQEGHPVEVDYTIRVVLRLNEDARAR